MVAIGTILLIGAGYHLLSLLATFYSTNKDASVWDSNLYLSLAAVEILTGIGFLILA